MRSSSREFSHAAGVKLDERGRCCGRKPLVYKRDAKLFCPRCDRAFDLSTGEQVANWAYMADPGDRGFVNVRGGPRNAGPKSRGAK